MFMKQTACFGKHMNVSIKIPDWTWLVLAEVFLDKNLGDDDFKFCVDSGSMN